MNKQIISLENIQLNIDNFSLNNINIDLFENEIHVIMGENGSGKSLLMQIVSGLVHPDSGTIKMNGEAITYKALSSTFEKDIVFVRQNADILDNLSIAENIFFNYLPYKNKLLKSVDYNQLNYMCKKLIDDLQLPVSIFDKGSSLGLAQRQIIEFCRAYVSNAKIVILDEPSAALTQNERDLLYRIVKSIKEKGSGVFYITHRLEDVLKLGDRISIIKKGTIVGTKKVSETNEEEIIKMLSGHYIKNRYPKLKIKKGKRILSVKNLGFQDKLDNINFDLHENEILGITGLAGSGRSLLANCLFGAVTSIRGKILINDVEKRFISPYDAIANGIALVPEDRLSDSLFSDLDINDNMSLSSLNRFANYLTINTNFLKKTVWDYIIKLNIPKGHKNNILEYSGGNQQKAIFAKWIMSRAKIFILDEPTRGLDIPSKIDIYNYINDLIKKGVGVIFISSDIEEILGICDRVAVLSDQTIVCDMPTKDISVDKILEYATLKT